MKPASEKIQNNLRQKDSVREQFTRTAEVFGDYAVSHRVEEAESLAKLVKAGPRDLAVDIASGPGTLALRFARHVRWIYGLDLTPAMLTRARQSAATQGLANIDFAVADAHALPFSDGSLDVAVTSYSLHHMPDPALVVAEMARVVRRGGRVAAIDIFLPDDPAVWEINDRIERFRDSSHTRTLPRSEFELLFATHGLRVLARETRVEEDSFNEWLLRAGWKQGDLPYDSARRLMESTVENNAAAFQPRYDAPAAGSSQSMPDIRIVRSMLHIAAEKS